MKKNLIYLWALALVCALVSCDKDNENGEGGVSANTISAKWVISDSKSPYSSFEFNKDGNYIVVKNAASTRSGSVGASAENSLFANGASAVSLHSDEWEPDIVFGNYKIDKDKITLSGFGVIEVSSITDTELSFSLTLQATGEQNSFSASKAPDAIPASNRTDMLCRTWVIERITVGGGNIEDPQIGGVVLFSRAGTYLVASAELNGLAAWKWADQSETKIYYSWENWMEDWSSQIVTITALTGTSLVILDGDWTWHLKLKQ